MPPRKFKQRPRPYEALRQVDVADSITLWNGKPQPIELEVNRRVLGLAEFRWQVKLEPGAAAKLEASWHYFWR